MIPTFVFGWPSGQETGDFLAVDLGASYSFVLTFWLNSSTELCDNPRL